MNSELLFPVFVIALAASATPGPNNAMLASSGANFGFGQTIPHMIGVIIGFPVMVLIVGFSLGQVFETSPLLRDVIRWAGAALLFWMAWKIATSGGISTADGRPRPMRVREAAAFQWINPKGWSLVIALTAQFVTGHNSGIVIPVIAATFAVTGIIGSTLWAGFGTAMKRWLRSQTRIRWFNRAMAALIVVSTMALVFGDLDV